MSEKREKCDNPNLEPCKAEKESAEWKSALDSKQHVLDMLALVATEAEAKCATLEDRLATVVETAKYSVDFVNESVAEAQKWNQTISKLRLTGLESVLADLPSAARSWRESVKAEGAREAYKKASEELGKYTVLNTAYKYWLKQQAQEKGESR